MDKINYKATLNLPKTEFPMKADLPKREPYVLQSWQSMEISKLISHKRKGAQKYILHDGPPYANGDIHIGHALNKILKDIIVKYKSMRGLDAPFVPGWDCHGLPVEHQLFKELGITKYQINQVEFRKKAYAYASKFVEIQKEQFVRLGIIADWEHPYLTLQPEYEEAIIRSFAVLVKKGYVYRGLKPVNWCYRCETALAEAEVEYEDHASPSVFVKFEIEQEGQFLPQSFLVIWTTTPWTLVANVAVAAHPDFTYSYVKTDKGNLLVYKEMISRLMELFGIKTYELIREYKGRELENISYKHPLAGRKGRVVLANYVSKEEGSGLVHTAPGHGSEDYFTGVKYKLDIIMPVDSKGVFDASAGEFNGLDVYSANTKIVEKLKLLGLLLFSGTVRHSYPHCWRCKNPVIFRATKQWFLKIDHTQGAGESPTLRTQLLEAIHQAITWIPPSGKERISSMVELRPDWCLSRQRYWGVPIPALACKDCNEEFLFPQVIEAFARLASEEGSDCWFKRPLADFMPSLLQCPHCGKSDFAKGADILDVWFDSGVSHQAVLKKRGALTFPCDLYLEGSDQHRGWFQSSLIPSICIDGIAPFKNVLTHGFVVDGEGRKMSKSLGNVISPFDIIKQYGAEIVRLWVASSNYSEDIRISSEIISRLVEAYRKIRNSARFILSNLYDYNPDSSAVRYAELRKIDVWILDKLESMYIQVTDAYEHFEFYKAYKGIYDFCNESLSMYYLDMVKGRLYTYASDSRPRRAVQTALYCVLNTLTRVMAPILAFTAEEIWQHMPKEDKDVVSQSVYLLDWPGQEELFPKGFTQDSARAKEADFEVILGLIPEVTKLLEEKRAAGMIGSSFDAKINILTNSQNRYNFLESLQYELNEVFKVSQVEIVLKADFGEGVFKSARYSDIAIAALKAEGDKCPRCWNYTNELLTSQEYGTLCKRCARAIKGEDT
jgi:isoleucyl-tRNA synthetase